MEEQIIQILTSHKRSTLEGLHMITGGDIDTLKAECDRLIECGQLEKVKFKSGRDEYWVYQRPKKKAPELF